jgi:outer membrane protein TolC
VRDGALPTTSTPEVVEPELVEDLVAQALAHPRLAALDARARAAEHRARALGGRRLPDVTVGADWIVTGPAVDPAMPDSGKDAVSVGVGVRVPLWQGTYGHEVEGARAAQQAALAMQRAEGDQIASDVAGLVAVVQDSSRRVERIEATLLPQAEAAYGSVLGDYAVGGSGLAQALLAQRDLLDLAVDLQSARASHQRAWARLHALVGGAG